MSLVRSNDSRRSERNSKHALVSYKPPCSGKGVTPPRTHMLFRWSWHGRSTWDTLFSQTTGARHISFLNGSVGNELISHRTWLRTIRAVVATGRGRGLTEERLSCAGFHGNSVLCRVRAIGLALALADAVEHPTLVSARLRTRFADARREAYFWQLVAHVRQLPGAPQEVKMLTKGECDARWRQTLFRETRDWDKGILMGQFRSAPGGG